ncbi:type IV secretion system protein [Pseudoxanthomonas sp.]|uniref:type IV secretion system protein n=1 Tax=Pseudoxanthomonas sp. TaxID=1871049 RepID=UPI00260D2108|nr:type IV secretion system protein [Pseudoxanthomonas sp.]WDS36050.1 MAG: type IV secretion system protein [Pseudoxanthomonas sp.]
MDDVLSGLTGLGFYSLVLDFISDEIAAFQEQLLARYATLLGVTALSILTVWIFLQGWRIVSGRSRDSMMALVGDSLRAMLIIGIATGWAGNSTGLYTTLTDGLQTAIYGSVTGDVSGQQKLYDKMDKNMLLTTVALGTVNSITAGTEDGSNAVSGESMLMGFMAVAGAGGPALAGGIMILLNKIAVALFTGLGPFFIICLLFDQTKSLFSKWLLYGAGTLFSGAVLYVMSTIAMNAMAAVAAAYWTSGLLQMTPDGGLRQVTINTAGLGLILTALLVTAPPMAAMFFQGMLGQFTPYAAIGPGSSTGATPAQRAPVQVQQQMPAANNNHGQRTPDDSRRNNASEVGPKKSSEHGVAGN